MSNTVIDKRRPLHFRLIPNFSDQRFPLEAFGKRFLSGVAFTSLGSVLTMAASTLASVAVARNTGPEGYAIFVASNMLVFISAVVCAFGLPLALAKHIAAEEERGNHQSLRQVATTAFLLLAAIAIVAGCGIAAGIATVEQYLNISFGRGFAFVFPLVLLSAILSDCIQAIYYGLLRPRRVIVITVIGPLLMFVYFFARHFGILFPIAGGVVVCYVASGCVAIYQAMRDRLFGWPVGLSRLTDIIKDAPSAGAFTFFTTFSVWIDRLTVGMYLGPAPMGLYTAAVATLQIALRIPNHIAYLLVPATARVELDVNPRRKSDFNKALIGSFSFFATIVAVIILLAPLPLIRFVFGFGFAGSAQILTLLLPSLLASAISIPLISALTGSTKSHLVNYLMLLSVLPRFLLLVLFTRQWGVLGTAVATALADIALACGCLLMARKIGSVFPFRAVARAYFTGIVAYGAGIVAFKLGLSHVIGLALTLLVFALTLWGVVRSFRPIFSTEPR